MPIIDLTINGQPRTYGNNEMDWRATIANAVRAQAQQNDLVVPIHAIHNFRMEITFKIHRDRLFTGNDLENLVKPVLDTLFLPDNPQVPADITGVLFRCDDRFISSLLLNKVASPDDTESAFVSIEYC